MRENMNHKQRKKRHHIQHRSVENTKAKTRENHLLSIKIVTIVYYLED